MASKKIEIKKGQRFGKLKIIKFDSDHISTGGRKEPKFLCKCDCGNEKVVLKRNLISSETKSCGCLLKTRFTTDLNKFKNEKMTIRDKMSKRYLSRIRLGAKRRGIEFNLTYEYLQNLFDQQEGKCKLSKIDIDFNSNTSGNGQTASLDRIDSKIGYIEGNVQWLHFHVNHMKQGKTNQEFITMCKQVTEFGKGK